MRYVRKVLSFILPLSIAFSLLVPALADSGVNSDEGILTVDDAVPGETYTIYEILVLDSYDTDTGEYVYSVDDEWAAFFEDGGAGSDYMSIEDGSVTWVSSSTSENFQLFADEAIAYAEDKGIEPAAEAVKGEDDEDDDVVFTGLNLGYYIVESSLGELCSLTAVDPETEVDEENELPELSYEVSDTIAAEGDTVTFTVDFEAGTGLSDYVLHVKLDDGLTLDGSSTDVDYVIIDDDEEYTYDLDTENYTLVTSDDTEDGCAFELEFEEDYIDSLDSSTYLEITYSATVNEDAEEGIDGNDNKVTLKFGEDDSITVTSSIYVDCFAVYLMDSDGNIMDGTFTLYTDEDCTEEAGVTAITDSDGTILGYELDDSSDSGLIEAGSTYVFYDEPGTWYLLQETAPEGYNVDEISFEIIVDEEGEITIEDQSTPYVDVVDYTSEEEENTATTQYIMYLIIIVIIAVVVLLVIRYTRKRMKKNTTLRE